MHWTADLFALATASLALYFNLRLKKNYFLDSKFFLAFANIGFILVILEDLVSKLLNAPGSITTFVVLNGVMAATVGFASFLLERNTGRPGFHELTEFLRNPPRTFTVYIAIVLSWTVSSLLLYPFHLHQSPGVEGYLYYYTSESWWLGFSAVLVGSFFAGPVFSLYRQSTRIRDAKVVRSMRIIVFCWTGFGVLEFIRGVAGSYSALAQGVSAVLDSFLFVMISLALKEPTFLGRIISGTQAPGHDIYAAEADTIVLYSVDSERRRLVENFARQESVAGHQAVCFVPKADVPLYMAFLRGVSGSKENPMVEIQPLEATLGDRTEVVLHPGFSRSRRELIDLGELDSSVRHRLIIRLRDMDALPGPSRKGRVWAMKDEGAGSELVDEVRRYSMKARVIELAGHQEAFSKLVGREHQSLLGNRVLLEYDPTSNFEEMVLKFVLEFQANVDPVAVFTTTGSPAYRRVKGHHNVRIFTASTKTSTPLKISEDEVLLPERDTSLLLDAVDKLLQVREGRSVGIAMDLITDLVLSQGFDRAYGALSSILEMAEVGGATLLVLVNHLALDERSLNGIRGLFRFQLSYDGEGLKPVRIPNQGSRRTEELASLSTGHGVSVN